VPRVLKEATAAGTDHTIQDGAVVAPPEQQARTRIVGRAGLHEKSRVGDTGAASSLYRAPGDPDRVWTVIPDPPFTGAAALDPCCCDMPRISEQHYRPDRWPDDDLRKAQCPARTPTIGPTDRVSR